MDPKKMPPPGTPEHEIICLVKARILNRLNLNEIAILNELMQPEPNFTGLIQTMRTQQKDNFAVMEAILGARASKLLSQYLP